MDLLAELQTAVLCGDGAMGTLLLAAGIPIERCFEELCVTEPDRIETIHRQYINAGARVIKTNTFGANAVRLERFGLQGRVKELNRAAAQVAAKAARGKNVYVAGSVGPVGISGEEAARRGIKRGEIFREQVGALLEGGADLIIFETFMDFDEMEVAFQAWTETSKCLALCSFACGSEGRLSSGMLLGEAFAKLRALGAQLVGVNCMNEPRGTVELLRRTQAGCPLAAYPSAGNPTDHAGRLTHPITPEDFALSAGEMVAQGARLIGGCCGTIPSHIAALSTAIAKIAASRR
jgi:methionine synthase / methylenetetrahydrofolate reductase (NADH)